MRGTNRDLAWKNASHETRMTMLFVPLTDEQSHEQRRPVQQQ